MYPLLNCCSHRHALHLYPQTAAEYFRRMRQPRGEATHYSPVVRHSRPHRHCYLPAGNSRRNHLGIRWRTLSGAIARLLQRVAGQHVLTWACRADELPGKGSQTEGGEAPALIHTVCLVSLESSFLPHLLQRLMEGSAR